MGGGGVGVDPGQSFDAGIGVVGPPAALGGTGGISMGGTPTSPGTVADAGFGTPVEQMDAGRPADSDAAADGDASPDASGDEAGVPADGGDAGVPADGGDDAGCTRGDRPDAACFGLGCGWPFPRHDAPFPRCVGLAIP
jgi:hypothetical protein